MRSTQLCARTKYGRCELLDVGGAGPMQLHASRLSMPAVCACQLAVHTSRLCIAQFWGSWVLQAGSCRELGASIYELDHVAKLAQDGSSAWLLPAIHIFSATHQPWGTVLVLL